MNWTIRAGTPADFALLLDIWLRSVRATHTFLTEADIQGLYPLVRDQALPSLELWVLCGSEGAPAGFAGLSGNDLSALFIAPEQTGHGGGRLLVEHARRLKGPLTVDVNEQNPEALRFYQSCGFRVIGRSPVDSGGRPFPLLHMADETNIADPGSDRVR
jgi:putative acetyltransferase